MARQTFQGTPDQLADVIGPHADRADFFPYNPAKTEKAGLLNGVCQIAVARHRMYA